MPLRNCSGGVDTLDGEAEAHGLEDGGEAAERGVSLFGQGAVELSWVEVGFLGYALDSSEGFCHLAKGDEELSLLAVFEDAVQEFECVSGVFLEQFGHRFVVGSISHCSALLCQSCQYSQARAISLCCVPLSPPQSSNMTCFPAN